MNCLQDSASVQSCRRRRQIPTRSIDRRILSPGPRAGTCGTRSGPASRMQVLGHD
jgi:hypothetical protein